VLPASGGTPRQLTSGPWNHSAPVWSSDGKDLLFSSLRVKDAEYEWRETEIYAVNVASGAVRQITSRKGPDFGPQPSPDGKLIAYSGYDWTDDTYITNHLYVMNADGSNPHEIAVGLDRTPEGVTWAHDGSGVYFSAQSEAGATSASRRSPAPRLTSGDHYLTVSSISNTGVAAATPTTATDQGNIVVFDVAKPHAAPGNRHQCRPARRQETRATEEIWYTSVDGFKIRAGSSSARLRSQAENPMMLRSTASTHGMFAAPTRNGSVASSAARRDSWCSTPIAGAARVHGVRSAARSECVSSRTDDLMAGVDTVLGRGASTRTTCSCTAAAALAACSPRGSWVTPPASRRPPAECPVINWMSFVGTTDGPGWYPQLP
jgi:hypothetical protein